MTEREMIARFLLWLQEREKGGATVVRIEHVRMHFAGVLAPPAPLRRRAS